MSSLRWVVKHQDDILWMYRYEGEAVKMAIYLNDSHQTDQYYVEKIDKRDLKHV